MSDISNIDDLLSGTIQSAPIETQEQQEPENDYSPNESFEYSLVDESEPESISGEDEPESVPQEAKEHDDYGNPKAKPRTYSEEEHRELVNKAVRERVERFERNNPNATQQQVQQVQKQAQDFEYNPESNESWQQQLEGFVEQTVTKMSQKQVQQQQAQREAQAEEEFRGKFTQGMDKFTDFRDVVSAQPITDAMTLALRGVSDPAAFIYAASKRSPQELQRIANIADPYSQMVEMGKLEERMRKTRTSTNAPKPLSRTQEDGTYKERPKVDNNPTIEQQIAASEARKLAKLNMRRR